MIDIKKLNFQKMDGLLPAIIQDSRTKEVLMLGFMDETALRRTLKTNQITFWSRTRQRLWRKGEESGNRLIVRSISADCDNDTLLIGVIPKGPVCHTGAASCFGDRPIGE